MKVRGVAKDLRTASQFGVFDKKDNAFKVAREVLPPPPREEQHVSRKLREFIQRQEALAQGKKPQRRQASAPGKQQGAPPPSAAPMRRVADQPSGPEAAGGSEKRKKKKYESRKQRLKRARREEVHQKAVEQEDVSRPAFGEVADAPPALTLKVKRGQAPASGGSTGNRLGRLFEQQMKRAVAGSAPRQEAEGLRQAHSREELRQSVISKYRELRGTNAAAALPAVQRPAP